MYKLLTISIPTWNRAVLLNELINDLALQIQCYLLEDIIQIMISDNASEDETWKIICEYTAKFNFISSNRNSTNLGAKSNVMKSMELANSKYVMFLGDDDRIRSNCLPEIIKILINNEELGIFIDISKFKNKCQLKEGYIDNITFFSHLFWYMGNAGCFITRTEFIKSQIKKYGYQFFNECWPQTQLMILGLSQTQLKPYVKDISIPTESKHSLVMVYSSYYLWRTCIYDMFISIENIKFLIPTSIYNSCRNQMKSSIKQNIYNILQCGIFIDDKFTQSKTKKDIFDKIKLFTSIEKLYLYIVVIVFYLPQPLSKILSNLFIWFLKGKKGLRKKDEFVAGENKKRKMSIYSNKEIRTLEFEG